jgi:hypothetical protein
VGKLAFCHASRGFPGPSILRHRSGQASALRTYAQDERVSDWLSIVIPAKAGIHGRCLCSGFITTNQSKISVHGSPALGCGEALRAFAGMTKP